MIQVNIEKARLVLLGMIITIPFNCDQRYFTDESIKKNRENSTGQNLGHQSNGTDEINLSLEGTGGIRGNYIQQDYQR
jgi:hypothetical protein